MLIRSFEDSKGKRRWHALGDNLPDVQRWLRDTPRNWGSSSTAMGRGHDWDFGVGYEGALRLAETGWSKGAEMMSEKLKAHFPEREHVDSWRYDVAGELPDIGRYLAGDPAHMRRHGHPKGRKPVLSMLVNICCSGGIRAEHFANYGAALCSVIDQLENSGRQVELNVSWISGFAEARLSCGWTVKHAGDPLDIAAVAFSLAHPAASRRLGFAMAERAPIRGSSAYGSVVMLDEYDWSDSPNMFLLQGAGHLNNTLKDAVAQVVETVNKCAGEQLVTAEG